MNDSGAKNIPLHGSIIRLLRWISQPSSFYELESTREGVDHRMNQIMGAATRYKDFWELDKPDCRQVDVEVAAWSVAEFHLVCGCALFDKPNGYQNHAYVKGYKYIASCINRAGWSITEAEAKLDALVLYKEPGVFRTGTSNVDGTSRVKAMAGWIISAYGRPIRAELQKISRCTGLKLRRVSSSQSSQKRAPEEVTEW